MEKIEIRILVCGGRDYGRRWNGTEWVEDVEQVNRLFKVLDKALAASRLTGKSFILIHGGARGADRLSGEWAKERNVETIVFYADWDTHKKAAGPIRNQKMLTNGKPDAIVAFKGGNGTAHMIRIGRKANVPVYEVKE